MENEKNEMKKKPGKVLPWLAAVLLAAALAARAAVPVPAGLFMQIWNIGTRLIILFSGLVLFSAAGLLLLFYTAALLLPIILAVFAVSLVVGWYRQARIKKAFENLKPFFGSGETTVRSGGRKSKIIDAEFEVVDDKDRKN